MPRNRHSYHGSSLRELGEGPPPPPGPRLGDYDIKVQLVAAQPHEDEQWYWHLYFRGEKVNGGIADNRERAREFASNYKFSHHRDMFLRGNFWDAEDCRWVQREVL